MRLLKTLARLKIYVTRAMTYFGIFNTVLIFGTFKKAYNIDISLFLIIPIGIFLLLLCGYLDYVLILKHETIHNNEQNNVKHQIDRIENIVLKIMEARK